MNEFFLQFPQVKSFTKQIVESCKSRGFVQTISRRKRFLPDINSEDIQTRNYAQRQAVNTVIQGSASDIVKQAMLKIRLNLSHYFGCSAKLVMQIHDEIVVEIIDESILEETIALMRDCMSCVPGIKASNVPFPVNIKCGKNLEDMKDYQELSGVKQLKYSSESVQNRESLEMHQALNSKVITTCSNQKSAIFPEEDHIEDIRFDLDLPAVKSELAVKLERFRFPQ
jgi:hypothetical protein